MSGGERPKTGVPATLPPTLLSELQGLAARATPGPWRECRDEVLIGGEWAGLCRPEDAAYVARLSPEVVNALINCATGVQSIAEELREIRNDLRPISPCLADRVEDVARKLAGGA